MKEETTPWIKASERLPEFSADVFIKYNSKNYGLFAFYGDYFKNSEYYPTGIIKDEFHSIEWLDESVIVRACNAHEEMKQLLTKMHDHIEKGNGMMLHGYDFKPWVTELFELSEQSKKLISKSEGK